ncbi:hypothetical protein AND_001169 [Anopheles darlingi]|uniref:Secreted protein n=1 Tax=Anopheles darlingi TaxID=43151 RepID=W5JSD4_ANODA|nr:hypothetical protein AND_001169 [Anopheles darlingi]
MVQSIMSVVFLGMGCIVSCLVHQPGGLIPPILLHDLVNHVFPASMQPARQREPTTTKAHDVRCEHRRYQLTVIDILVDYIRFRCEEMVAEVDRGRGRGRAATTGSDGCTTNAPQPPQALTAPARLLLAECNRIVSALFVIFDGDMEPVTLTLLHLDTTDRRYALLLYPLFESILRHPPAPSGQCTIKADGQQTDEAGRTATGGSWISWSSRSPSPIPCYVRWLLCFQRWKSLVSSRADRAVIEGYAIQLMPARCPTVQLTADVAFLRLLPAVPAAQRASETRYVNVTTLVPVFGHTTSTTPREIVYAVCLTSKQRQQQQQQQQQQTSEGLFELEQCIGQYMNHYRRTFCTGREGTVPSPSFATTGGPSSPCAGGIWRTLESPRKLSHVDIAPGMSSTPTRRLGEGQQCQTRCPSKQRLSAENGSNYINVRLLAELIDRKSRLWCAEHERYQREQEVDSLVNAMRLIFRNRFEFCELTLLQIPVGQNPPRSQIGVLAGLFEALLTPDRAPSSVETATGRSIYRSNDVETYGRLMLCYAKWKALYRWLGDGGERTREWARIDTVALSQLPNDFPRSICPRDALLRRILRPPDGDGLLRTIQRRAVAGPAHNGNPTLPERTDLRELCSKFLAASRCHPDGTVPVDLREGHDTHLHTWVSTDVSKTKLRRSIFRDERAIRAEHGPAVPVHVLHTNHD